MVKALINVRIYDYQNYIENGYIIFDEKILKVGPMDEYVPGDFEAINGHGFLILPNLVVCHTHVYNVLARGLSLPNLERHEVDYILNKMISKLNKDDAYYCGICAGSEFLRNGVTTVIDHHSSGANIIGSLEKLEESMVEHIGIRAMLSFACSDRYKIERCIQENTRFIENNKTNHVRGLFGIESSSMVNDENMKKIAQAVNGNPIIINVAETREDVEDCKNKYGKTIIERLNDYGLLNPGSLLVNCNYISNEELDILKDKDVYIVLNPSSDMNFNSYIVDAMRFKKRGLKVLIGNSGLSNTIVNEYQTLYFASNCVEKCLTPQDLIDIINNSFEYASKMLGVKLGRIAPGYEADFSSLLYTPFSKMDSNNAFEHIYFGLYSRYSPNSVFVGGKCLIKNGKPLESKVERELEKAKDASMGLWKRLVQ